MTDFWYRIVLAIALLSSLVLASVIGIAIAEGIEEKMTVPNPTQFIPSYHWDRANWDCSGLDSVKTRDEFLDWLGPQKRNQINFPMACLWERIQEAG